VADLVGGYNIIQKVGDGARSRVFQVVNPVTGQVFALKRVIREKHEDTRFLEQAINEFRVSSCLEHTSLRKCHELSRLRKLFRMWEVQVVMEYVDGVSLDKRRPERIDQTVDLFLKVAEGLEAMHQANWLHTDIKPNNILVTLDGEVKIIDFGQSCPIGFRKPRIQGTPDYIAPEQVERRCLTRQTDVFNLGAALYWALTGQAYPTMITKKGRVRDRQSATRKPVPPPQALNPEIPSALSRLVMEACASDPLRRPRDMKEVIGRLEMVHHVLAKRRRAGHDMSTTTAGPEPAPGSVSAAGTLPPDPEDPYDYSALADAVRKAAPEKDQPTEDAP
jgi:serine/threonine-protein kinase